MARHTSRRRRKYDYDEPYNPLPRPRGSLVAPASLPHGTQGWWVGGAWIEPPAQKCEQRSRLSPIIIDKGEDSDCYEVLPPTQSVKPSRMPQSAPFDFNNGEQILPWAELVGQPSNYTARSFADTADDELLSYLANRSISRGFLVEIDHLLKDHPEISDHPEGREMIMQVNSLSPLEAYKYFLRGYTRPARYIDGVIKSDHFVLPAQYPYQPLSTKNDPELVDFFEGIEYRWDIIDRIDKLVRAGVYELSLGRPISSGYMRLICYAVWGNPADAYKWYEYQLQEEYLPHRYLPEHVVLQHSQKVAGDAVPLPSSLDRPRRHKDVRYRMAKANDDGMDVLEVLLTEFKMALVRRGFRRADINLMYERAKIRLENERQCPTGVDIVDFIMDEIPVQRPARRTYHNNRRPHSRPIAQQFENPPISFRPTRRRKNNKIRVQNIPPALQTQATELRSAKANLERAYNQEQNVMDLKARCTGVSFNCSDIIAARARAERRYVNCLIRYARNANLMSPVQARELQANFTRHKMEDSGMNNRSYLLGMYPRELK